MAVALAATSVALARRQTATFVIRAAYGATRRHALARTAGMLAAGMLALPLPALAALALVGAAYRAVSLAAVVVAVGLFLLLSLVLSRLPAAGVRT